MAKCFSDIDFKLVKKKCNDCSCAADDIKGIKCADLELTGGYYLCRPCFLRSRDSYTYYYEVWGYCNKCNGEFITPDDMANWGEGWGWCEDCNNKEILIRKYNL